MTSRVTPITNAVSLSSAHAVYGATTVLVVNTGTTDRTITVANTVSPANGGGKYGFNGATSQATITLVGVKGTEIIVNKKATDTINGGHSEVKGTGIANAGDA